MSGVARGSKTISNASKSFYQNVVPKPVPRSSQRQYLFNANKTYTLEQADTQSPKNSPSLKNIDPSRVLPSSASSSYPCPLPNRPETKGQTTPQPLAPPSDHLCKYEDVYKRPRKSEYDGNQVVPLFRNDDSESSIDRIGRSPSFKQIDPNRCPPTPACRPPPLPRRPQAQAPIAPPEEVYNYEPVYENTGDEDELYEDLSNVVREDRKYNDDQIRDNICNSYFNKVHQSSNQLLQSQPRVGKSISNVAKSGYQNVVLKPVPTSSQRQDGGQLIKTQNLKQVDTQPPNNSPNLQNIDPSRTLPSSISPPLPYRPETKGQTTPQHLAPPPSDDLCKYEDVCELPDELIYDGYQDVLLSRNDDSVQSNDRKRFMYEEPRFEFDLLLIGKTGQGKSALGNSILWRKAFESEPSTRSVTKTVSDEQVEYKGKVINVVDGPGVGDTDLNVNHAKNMIVESLSEAMTINLRGYHAFLLVVKFGERYTRESCIAIEVLKSVFGENFVKKFCILVMTFGDLFEGESFRDWLSKQTGDMIDLVKECDNRVILYDSKTKEKRKRDRQLDALLDMVQTLALKNGRYTSEQFDLAKLSRDALTVEPKKLLREEDIMKEANLILTNLQSLMIKTEYMEDPNIYKRLEVLQSRATLLLDSLKEEDYNIGVSQDLINNIQSLQKSINDEIESLHRIYERMKSVSWDRKAAMTVRIRKKRNEFYLNHVEGDKRDKAEDKSTSQTDLESSSKIDYEDIYIMEEQ